MKLGQLLGLGENPLYQFFDTNRNATSGLLSEFGSGDMAAATRQGGQIDQVLGERKAAEAERQQGIKDAIQQKNQTMSWIGKHFPQYADLPPAQAFQLASQDWARQQQAASAPATTDDITEFQYAKQNGYTGGFKDWLAESRAGGGSNALGTTIYTGRDEKGNVVPMQVGQGGLVAANLPEGVRFDPGAMNAARAEGTVEGKAAGQASVDLPKAKYQQQIVSQQIEDLKKHPGLDELFWSPMGIPVGQNAPTIGGTQKASAIERINQLSGQAFLEGRVMLKGGGAITDFESKKAEAAFARLSTAQTKEDFIAALDDFNAALAAGVQKLEAAAAKGTSGGGQSAPSGGGAGTTSTGVPWSVEP